MKGRLDPSEDIILDFSFNLKELFVKSGMLLTGVQYNEELTWFITFPNKDKYKLVLKKL